MEATPELRTKLRKMLNESIPAGGTEADTSLLDSEIDELLGGAESIYAAASLGWTQKAGLFAARTEKYQVGQERYEKTSLKDLIDQALKLASYYQELAKTSDVTKRSGYMFRIQPPPVL